MLIIIYCLFLTSLSNAVRVNMHGSLSVGKEVMDTLTRYMSKNNANFRRSMGPPEKPLDRIADLVKQAFICRNIEMCKDKKDGFINEYVTMLANAVESIFVGILHPADTRRYREARPNAVLFEEQITSVLAICKKILKHSDLKMEDGMQTYVWSDVLKKISGKFQEAALQFTHQRLEGDPKEMQDVKKRLTQKLVLAIAIVETKFETALCTDYNYCDSVKECSSSLNSFLEELTRLPDYKVRMFMRHFHESLPENFLPILNENTATEFQVILSDMIYSELVPARDILKSVQQVVETRLKTKNANLTQKSYDALLIHAIMSDMDHFYPNKNRIYPFDPFLVRFSEWVRTGGKLNSDLSQVMASLKNRILEQPKVTVDKLKMQVKVFLELTVD